MTLRDEWTSRQQDETRNVKLRVDQIKDRLNRLTDAYLDQALDKTMFEERKKSLFLEQRTVEENLANLIRNGARGPERLEKFLELAGNASLSHEMASPEEKREMVQILTSNLQVTEKKLDLKPSSPFQEIAYRFKNATCDLERAIPRTWDRLLAILTSLNSTGQLPDLPAIFARRAHDTTDEITLKE